jgi:hypothetical protein
VELWPDTAGRVVLNYDALDLPGDDTRYSSNPADQPPPPNLEVELPILAPDQVDPALESAIRAWVEDRRSTYAGPCAATRLPDDAGKLCSIVRPRPNGLMRVAIGPAFSDGGTVVTFARQANGWAVVGNTGR